jgi:hypothetical protein
MRPAAAKLIYLFVKVDLCADVCAVAQTTQPKSGLSRLPPRLECVISRLRGETIEHYIALTIASSSQIPACSNRSSFPVLDLLPCRGGVAHLRGRLELDP